MGLQATFWGEDEAAESEGPMTSLHLAKGVTFPTDTVTQTIAILAKRRVGKSYLMRRLAEQQLFAADQQIVIVDPKGDQWGIRSSADGKGPGLPVVILGGERGDVPLEASAGELVAKLVVEQHVSILLDLSLFRKHEVATFMTAFLENLYRLKAREVYRTPVMLVIDEADAVAPQKPQRGEERMLGAAEDIVRRGGQRGIGCVLVTQRSAVLNKNVLTQAQVLIALRTIAPQDLAALNAWIDVHGTAAQRKTLMESLPALPVGDAWFWSPGWPTTDGIFVRAHVLPIETFDSGATPKPGVKPIEPKNLADVDLDALKGQMAATIEKAKAEDPRELRARIRELEGQLAKAGTATPATKEKRVEVKVNVLNEPLMRRLEAAVKRLATKEVRSEEALRTATDARRRVEEAVRALERRLEEARRPAPDTYSYGRIPSQRIPSGGTPLPPRPTSAHRTTARGAGDTSLPKGERIVLTAIAQHDVGVTREQLTVLTGYKRSSRDTYVQRLRERGLVDVAGEQLVASDAGVVALGSDFEPLPTGDALREYWMQRLPEGERRVLQVLVEAYPKAVERERISDLTEYKRSSRDTYLQRLSARKLVQAEGRGAVRASAELVG